MHNTKFMGRFLRLVFFVGLLFSVFCLLSSVVNAQTVEITGASPSSSYTSEGGVVVPNPFFGDRIIYPGKVPVQVAAQVGEFVVNISGLASPNASIVLSSEGQFVRSTVADSRGYFYITGVSVKKGFSSFCLQAVDFKRIGESEACLTFEPVVASRDFKDIFLPPTIGLFKKQINAGEEALIFGYSMPGAKVEIKIRDGQTFIAQADNTGYYEYRYKKVPAGTYFLTSDAEFENKKSLPPTREAKLEALSIPGAVTLKAKSLIQKIWELLTTTIWGFVLILLILLLIIISLILILKPAWTKFLFDKFKRHKPMHHDWLLEFLAEKTGQNKD